MESAILEGVSKTGNMGEEGINSRNVSAMGVQGEEREGGGAALGRAGGIRRRCKSC